MVHSYTFTSQFTIRIMFLLFVIHCLCITSTSGRPILDGVLSRDLILARDRAIVKTNAASGEVQVLDPDTKALVPQGPATDGSGFGWDLPHILWLGFSSLVGLPLALAGIRGWRFTCGTGLGLAMAVSAYAAIINTVDEVGVTDLILTCIVLAFFVLGFIMGFFEFARLGGITLIGVTGGIALGMRIVLGADSLIFSSAYTANWAIVGVLGAAGGLIMIWKQRIGLLFGCASSGTFFVALALDLILSQQSGMSRGLRFLLDRNPSHLEDIIGIGYHPSLTTRIIIYSSLGLTPILAYLQHRIFKHTFSRVPELDDTQLQIDFPTEKPPARMSQGFLTHLWEGARSKSSPNRFSVESWTAHRKRRR